MLMHTLYDMPLEEMTMSHMNMQVYSQGFGHSHAADATGFMRLVYILEGSAVFTHAGGTLEARAGDMLYWPCDVAYVSLWSGVCNQFAVIDMRLVDSKGTMVNFGDAPRVLFRDAHRLYEGYMDDIANLSRSAQPFAWLERISLALKLCCEIAREQTRGAASGAYGRIYAGIVYLEAHYTENFTIDELANMCAMSAACFGKLFCTCKSMSPVDYRNSLRIRRATELLREGMSVTRAAEAVGINDLKYFSKLFKRFTGLSPSVIKRETQKGIAGGEEKV